ncbi:unannotated protein [freshwater metagenome]|uniref:Unannotated protein n=1 Tax=freshwater metagenome TaxID=449393 RepID=A0A6J6JNC8_9ZZZZ
MKRILSLDDLLNKVGNDVRHSKRHIPRLHFNLALRSHLTDAHTVEWANDRVGKSILVPRGLREILNCKFLESVGRQGRRNLTLIAFDTRPMFSRLEHHRRTHVGDFLQVALSIRSDRSVAGRGHNALVLGKKVVGKRMEVADTTNQCRSCDEVIAVHKDLRHQVNVYGIANNKFVLGI